jgi:hypothetical protein
MALTCPVDFDTVTHVEVRDGDAPGTSSPDSIFLRTRPKSGPQGDPASAA